MYKLLFILVLIFSSPLLASTPKNVKATGTVFYYGKQFFFFEFQGNSIASIINGFKKVKGVKLWSLDISSYSNALEGMNCLRLDTGKVNKWSFLYYMEAKVEYEYLEFNYENYKVYEQEGNIFIQGKLIPFVIKELYIVKSKFGKSLGKLPNQSCKKRYKDDIESGFPPGTFFNPAETR